MSKWLFLAFLFLPLFSPAFAGEIKVRSPQCWTGLSYHGATCADSHEALLPAPSGSAKCVKFYRKDPFDPVTWTLMVGVGYYADSACSVSLDGGSGIIIGACKPPATKGQDAQGFYCLTTEADCSEKAGNPYDLKSSFFYDAAGPKEGGMNYCDGDNCQVYASDFSFSWIKKDGAKTGYQIQSGSGSYTGGKCTADDKKITKTQDPEKGENTEPTGPADCPQGTRFGNVNGKNVCAGGKGLGDKKTEFCQVPANDFKAECSEGGSEFCKANPTAQACVPGSDRYCALSPDRKTGTACTIGSEDFCKSHPDHASCTAGSSEFCALHPEHADCQQKQADLCKQNPESAECKKAEACLLNPNDPACKTATTDDYCKKFPTDPKCKTDTAVDSWTKPGNGTVDSPFGDLADDRDAAINAFSNYIGQIQQEASTLVHINTQGAGALPTLSADTVFGRIEMDFKQLDGPLSKIGMIVIMIATIVAAFVVFKP